MNRTFENEMKEREFQNIEKYKPITESNKQLINMIEKKNDQMVGDIVNPLPYHKKEDKTENDLLPVDDKTQNNIKYNE